MNKYNYRVIFSEALHTFIAVAEYAVARKKHSGVQRIGGSLTTKPLRISALSVLIAGLFGNVPIANAQMVAYKNGSNPQVIIDRSASGKPVLQIVNPNAKGLSHNQYDQFNVDGGGVVLNNSPVDVNTQLAGYVQGNPQLGAPARIILNEVMSTSRSALNGYLEVAGQRAEVIVANPNGISIGNGAGFINTSRAIVTTGKPVFGGDGSLAAFRVTQGDITVNSGGLTAVQTDQLDLMARNIQINDAISANQLNVLAGANQINYATLGITVIPGVNGQPTLAVDSSSLGGMYAQKIRFVSTEQGLGVNLNGNLVASAGSMSLNSAGQLTLNANTNATGQIAINVQGDMINTGTLYGQSDVAITSSGDLTNTGAMLSSSDMMLYADSLTSTGLLGAGVNGDGDMISGNLSQTNTSANGGLSIASNTITNNGGTLVASGRLALNGHGQHSTLNNNQGRIQSNGTLSIAMDSVSNQGGQIETNSNGSTLSITADSIDNTSGRIANASNGATNLAVTNQLINQNGLVGGNGDVSIAAAYLNNANGRSVAGGDFDLHVANLANQGGTVYASGNLTLDEPTGIIDNTNGTLSAGQNITLASSFLNNTEGTIATAQGDIAINQGSTLINTGGHISAAHDLNLTAAQLTGDGVIIAGNDATLSLENDYTNTANNLITANHVLTFTTKGKFINQGIFSAGNGLHLFAHDVTNDVGALMNSGLTHVATQHMLWNKGRIYGDAIALAALGYLTNDANAVIASRDTLDIGSPLIYNEDNASIISLGDMSFGNAIDDSYHATGKATQVANSSATIDAGGNLNLNAANLFNLNVHFKTGTEVISVVTKVDYSFDGVNWYALGDGATWHDNDSYNLIEIGGRIDKHFYERTYTQTATKTIVLTSKPAQIVANGTIGLNVDNVNNYASVIVANLGLGGGGSELYNNTPRGVIHTTLIGDPKISHGIRYHDTDSCGLRGEKECNRWSGYSAFSSSLPDVPIDLTIWPNGQPDRLTNPAKGQPAGTNPIVDAPSSDIGDGQTIIAPDGRLPGIQLPTNQLFIIRDDPSQHYLVETDPAFTNYDSFLSSDYMLSRLGMDPSAIQKRLGDGYYEQSLVQNQILQLTGKRFIGNYSSNEAEYQALMNNGVTYAEQFNLTPGVALSAEQMAALTSDMVWLVKQTVTLPDGSTQQVLAPVVYLAKSDSANLSPTGALIAAQNVNLNYKTANNAGAIQGDNQLVINATDLTNSGTLSSRNSDKTGAVLLSAANDLTSTGTLDGNVVAAQAGHDLTIQSSTGTAHNLSGDQTDITKVATINADKLILQGGHNTTINAAAINTTGDATITAGNDLNIGTLTTQSATNASWGAEGHLNANSSQTVGSQIQTGGNLTLAAGNDINATATYVNSNGQITAAAGHDININAGQQTASYDNASHFTSSGFLTSGQTDLIDKGQSQQAISSTFSGDKVTMVAKNNLTVTGSNVVASNGGALIAGNDVTITTSDNTSSRYYDREEQQSGLMAASGGIGVMIGSKDQETTQTNQSLTHTASNVGALNGNLTIQAGSAYTQTGSNVLSVAGDTTVLAKKIDINEAINTQSATQDTRYEQSGLTIAVTAPVIEAAQTVSQMATAVSQVNDPRLQLMGAVVAADAASKVVGDVMLANSPSDLATGGAISVTLGSSKSQSHSETTRSTVQGSTIAAGGNLTLIATGSPDSHINVTGSNVTSGGNFITMSNGPITLDAAANTSSQHSTSSSSSAGVGVAATIGADKIGVGVTANASSSRGKGDGNDVTYTNTNVSVGKQWIVEAGSDVNLKGATVNTSQMVGQIQGNLNLESLQNTSTYNSKDQSIEGDVLIGITNSGVSGSINAAQTKVNGTYQSVGQQTGIFTGDGGFQVDVKGNTDLKGAVIASSQAAIDANKNQLTTGTLTQSDLSNTSHYEASSATIGLSTSAMAAPGYDSQSGSQQSTTHSGISGNANGTGVAITNAAGQFALTGKTIDETVAAINKQITSSTSANGLTKDWNADQLKTQVTAGAQITASFNQLAGQAVNDYATQARSALQQQLKNTSSPDEQKAIQGQIDDINVQEHVLNILVGAVTGSGVIAVTRESLSTLADQMRQGMITDSKKFGGVTDGETTLTNMSGDSAGLDGDGIKVGGTRADLDKICGTANERCVTNDDGSLKLKNGQIQFDTVAAGMSLKDYLQSEQGQEMVGATGGVQGAEGTLFGYPYKPGSWQDQLVEAFAGTHDTLGGKLTGYYDHQGTARRGMTDAESKAYDYVVSPAAVIPSIPFAMAAGLPPDVWNAISILLKTVK